MVNMFDKIRINDLNYGLNVSSVKNDVIAKNIANADTPFYKAKKIKFKEVMEEYFPDEKKIPLIVTDEQHIQPGQKILSPSSFVRYQNNMSPRNDFNDVNLDYEMSELAKNGINYSMMGQITSNSFAKLKEAIRGR
ncbi:MAG: flagellar basal body rod protein FlgB [Deferribacterota bacterium]|nr:flagellar basal body rod protein FlgB [Deferribacterota bacterium]